MSSEANTVDAVDPRIRTYLVMSENEAEVFLGDLLAGVASPVIDAVLRSRLRGSMHLQSAEDLKSEVFLGILKRLRRMREVKQSPIVNFESYVAVATYHAINASFRAERPAFARLQSRIRYAAKNVSDLFFQLRDDGRSTVSLDSTKDAPVADATRLSAVDPRSGCKVDSIDSPDNLVKVLKYSLRAAGAPVRIDELTTFLMKEFDRGEAEVVALEDGVASHPAGSRLDEAEEQARLAALWEEVRQLPPNQRRALLLNLRDPAGRSALELLLLLGIVQFATLAETLEMSVEELSLLWIDLPLDDLTIADQLQLSRQQVINLRKSARERLARRMSRSGW